MGNDGEAAGDQPDQTGIGPAESEPDPAHAAAMRAQAEAMRAQAEAVKTQAKAMKAHVESSPAQAETVRVEQETVRVQAGADQAQTASGVAQVEAVLDHAEAEAIPKPVEPGVALAERDAAEDDPDGDARFRIFVIDTGWNSDARKILNENFALIRDLNREDPVYFLDRDTSLALLRKHRSLVGRDPIILVQDMRPIRDGRTDRPGFRLHLGLLRDKNTALAALQMFARFMSMEGFSGAMEVIGGSSVHEFVRV